MSAHHIGGAAGRNLSLTINPQSIFNPIDPKGLLSNVQYFPRISQSSLKIPLKFRADTQIQSVTNAYFFYQNEMVSFPFNLIFWTPICGEYFLHCSILEKWGEKWKNCRFSGQLWPDWGNTARAATARLGSQGLKTPDTLT